MATSSARTIGAKQVLVKTHIYPCQRLSHVSQGLADVLAAPSTSPELKGTGWGRETRLALELLSKTLTDWMEQAKRASKLGGVGGVDEDDNSGGYASMSKQCRSGRNRREIEKSFE